MLVKTTLQTCSFVFTCLQDTLGICVALVSRTLPPLCGQRPIITSAKVHRIVGGGGLDEGQHAEGTWGGAVVSITANWLACLKV